MYNDDFMAGFTLRDSPDFDEWQFFESEALRDKLAGALERLVRWHSSHGEYEHAIGFARRWLALGPLAEAAHRRLMALYAESGQRNAALRQYAECERLLQQELGVSPEEQTTALYETLRVSETLRVPAPRHNLPTQATLFIGRETELAEIGKLLNDPDCRLLTLIGPGGSGKTRLALEAAAGRLNANADEHGVFFVSLAPLSLADTIVPTVADVLGFQFYAEGTPQQQLLDFLRQRNLVLIMDNYEHLLEGAGLVSDIIKTSPGVKVLATSRERLNVGGEHRFLVEGMDYPREEIAGAPSVLRQAHPGERPPGLRDALQYGAQDALQSTPLTLQDAAQYSAVELFTESARRARPDFQLTDDNLSGVLDVCRRTEGMPLAIRLAAAWVAVLTPSEIAVEIGQNIDVLATERRDVPERQRSMRAASDHSWTMLTEREREVMRALSVFRGVFTRKAAQQVSGASLAELMALVNKSLVHSAPGGYAEVHELLRQYAAEKLSETPSDREAVHDRHCAYYAAALHGWGSDLQGPRQLEAVKEMDLEIENTRAAWDWAAQRVKVPSLDRAMEGLFLFYEWRGRYLEGEGACRVAGNALATSKTAGALRMRAKILAWQGVFQRHMGRDEIASQLAGQSLSLLDAPELADADTRAEKAAALRDLGWASVFLDRKDQEKAPRLLKQSLGLYRLLGDRWEVAHVLLFEGAAAYFLGSGAYDQAEQRLQESLAIFQALGDQRGIAMALGALSENAEAQWRLERAERLARESVAINREIGHLHVIVTSLLRLDWVLGLRGKFAEQQAVLEEALDICYELGVRRHTAEAHYSLGLTELHMGNYDRARAQAEMGLAIAREEYDIPWVICIALSGLGMVALAEGTYTEAYCVLLEAESLWPENAYVPALLGIASLRREQIPQAREHIGAALRVAADTRNHVVFTVVLPTFALLLAARGDADAERAVELYALASRYPRVANSCWFEEVAGTHVSAAAADLPSEAFLAAQERGRTRDLWETVEELLDELRGQTGRRGFQGYSGGEGVETRPLGGLDSYSR